MELEVVKIGKPAFPECQSLVQRYERRLGSQFRCGNRIVKKVSELRPLAMGVTILLDKSGETVSSQGLASLIERWQNRRTLKKIRFVIGDAHGFALEDLRLGDKILSFGQLTLQGDLAWVLCWEQLYRAASINNGGSYHH